MLKRVINFSLVSVVCLSFLPMYACSNDGDDDGTSFGSFGTTQTTTLTTTAATTMTDEESGDGDGDGTTGDGDGDGDTAGDGDGDGDTAGDGDGDTAGDGDGDGDTGCPLGEFGCPCDNGQCAPGLSCGLDNVCGLGGGDGDGDPSGDGDGDPADPWDPATCVMPSVPVMITGLAGEMCSAPCVDDVDCPAGPAGTSPACALIFDMDVDPSQCALICDPLNDACSAGASCKAIPDQPDIGICTYP
jgi:hypothetical protein